ncbi:SH3 domain-containing protein [Desulfobacca acetoxidans]
MKTLLFLISVVLSLAFNSDVWAGYVITRQFTKPGVEKGREALPHLQNKGLIAEFLDPGDTGLGKCLGYLIWREVLTAISDQSGAGVILAHPPGQERIVDLLEKNYHLAALEIARDQRCSMALWGAVWEQGEQVFLNSFLSVLPEVRGGDLLIRLKPVPGLEAEIARTRYNFALVQTNRNNLFERTVVTRRSAVLRAEPQANGRPLQTVPTNTPLAATAMQGGWFVVKTTDGGKAFVDNSLVEVPPRQVEGKYNTATLFQGPGQDSRKIRTVYLDGEYRVLDMRYRRGLWYKIDLGDTQGWVAGHLVDPKFSLPAVHFMAGLYRYRAGNYRAAIKEFTSFREESYTLGDRANLATSMQFKGAAQLFLKDASGALDSFSYAVELTPFDPAAYNLEALAILCTKGQLVGTALYNLERALKLDSRNPRTLALISVLQEALVKGKHRSHIESRFESPEKLAKKLQQLREQAGLTQP